MRRAARKDDNHNEVAKHLKDAGWKLLDLSGVGNGCPDILAGRGGFLALLELKDGTKPPSARKLTDAQERFWKDWPGVKIIAKSPEDAEAQLNLAESYQYLRTR